MFDPNGVGINNNNLFGFPVLKNKSRQIEIIPACIDVTASYGKGTAQAPKYILEASTQLDFYHPLAQKNLWEKGIKLHPIKALQLKQNKSFGAQADKLIQKQETGKLLTKEDKVLQHNINQFCKQEVENNYQLTKQILDRNNKPTLIGGDHSNTLGVVKALSEIYSSFGILQLDAHADLRQAYEGFSYSHASIMYNILSQIPEVTKIVQFGIRDLSPNEETYISNSEKISTFYARDLQQRILEGSTWKELCQVIVQHLPEYVYVTYDIDVLEQHFCPNTGTPVPGGLSFEAINYLFAQMQQANVHVIGFDLCEVGSHVWDANVGARVFWEMCNLLGT